MLWSIVFHFVWLQGTLSEIPLPDGFHWVNSTGYAHFLAKLPLKREGSLVHLFDQSLKTNQDAHYRVLDLEVGKRDLQQCADAAIRLRADYLRSAQHDMVFHATNGQPIEWSQYQAGKRLALKGSRLQWQAQAAPSDSEETFRAYLDQVFAYAGSQSLHFDSVPIRSDQVQTGDMICQPGSPGHVVIVVGYAEDGADQRMVLLAQSYMPAQEIHVLVNPDEPNLSPWYRWDQVRSLRTPQWFFEEPQFLRWK